MVKKGLERTNKPGQRNPRHARFIIYTSTDSLFYVYNGWKRERDALEMRGGGVTAAPPRW